MLNTQPPLKQASNAKHTINCECKIQAQQGFSLLEVALVMVLMALILGGLLPALSLQWQQLRVREMNNQWESIQENLLGFAVREGRLPCPALPSLPSNHPSVGLEARDATTKACQLAVGVLPSRTLGVPALDPWGRRLTYAVSVDLARVSKPRYGCDSEPSFPPNDDTVAFALCSQGNLTVSDANSSMVVLAESVPVVLVSHGQEGAGAWLPSGQQRQGAVGQEALNADGDRIFRAGTPSMGFDDQVYWLPMGLLTNRLMAAGRMP